MSFGLSSLFGDSLPNSIEGKVGVETFRVSFPEEMKTYHTDVQKSYTGCVDVEDCNIWYSFECLTDNSKYIEKNFYDRFAKSVESSDAIEFLYIYADLTYSSLLSTPTPVVSRTGDVLTLNATLDWKDGTCDIVKLVATPTTIYRVEIEDATWAQADELFSSFKIQKVE